MTPTMQLVPMSITHAKRICSWHYPAPYNHYQWPSWDDMTQMQIEFGDPSIRSLQYRSIVLEDQLIGYIQLFPLIGTIRLALFLSPHHCDRGLGNVAIQLAVTEAQHQYPNFEIDLEVETWNIRAIRCYERAGFTITDEYVLRSNGKMKRVFCMVFN